MILLLWRSRALGFVRRIVWNRFLRLVPRFLRLQIILSDVFAEIRKRIVVVTSATALFLPHRRDRRNVRIVSTNFGLVHVTHGRSFCTTESETSASPLRGCVPDLLVWRWMQELHRRRELITLEKNSSWALMEEEEEAVQGCVPTMV